MKNEGTEMLKKHDQYRRIKLVHVHMKEVFNV